MAKTSLHWSADNRLCIGRGWCVAKLHEFSKPCHGWCVVFELPDIPQFEPQRPDGRYWTTPGEARREAQRVVRAWLQQVGLKQFIDTPKDEPKRTGLASRALQLWDDEKPHG